MATYKRRKFLNQRKRADRAPENTHTDPAPIRAKAPLIEQFYVAVDRQLKSGFETYEAAEKAAQEIKKRYPGPQVTVFDAKNASSRRRKSRASLSGQDSVLDAWWHGSAGTADRLIGLRSRSNYSRTMRW
jgi:hypothetical protein